MIEIGRAFEELQLPAGWGDGLVGLYLFTR